MRYLVFLIVAAQLAVFVWLGLAGGQHMSGAAGTAMPQGMISLAGMVMAAFTVPATILALVRRAVPLALLLSLVPPVLLILWLG